MKLSVCIDAVFNGWDFIDGMKATKSAGIDAIEFWSWWNKDINAIDRARKDLGLEVAAFCTKFISLVDASKRQGYKAALSETIEVAKKLECTTIITQVGQEIPHLDRGKQQESLIQSLRECVPILEEKGMTLVFEPLNTITNHKGYYLWSSEEAFEIQRIVGSSHVKVLYDIYHQQIMEGHLISRISENIQHIGHFHSAGNPGRHELSIGEINYPEVFKAIRKTGYTGYMGLEYFPSKDPMEGLAEVKRDI